MTAPVVARVSLACVIAKRMTSLRATFKMMEEEGVTGIDTMRIDSQSNYS